MPTGPTSADRDALSSREISSRDDRVRTQVEHHTEFLTIIRVTRLEGEVHEWPRLQMAAEELAGLIGTGAMAVVCRTSVLVLGTPPEELGSTITALGFKDSAASYMGGGSALVCSDFRVKIDGASRVVLFNKDLNSYRLGRMVRRLHEIETYRSMALHGLPEARRLSPLLAEISSLSAQIISAAAATRSRFGATVAYSKIVEERISELRETHVPGFQRFGVFVLRRFKPAIRTCEATSLRLEQLSRATMHLLDLLQTRIQSEIEYQNAVQIKAMADRAATQIKIQQAVEGFSIIAISYYLLGTLKMTAAAAEHGGFHVSPILELIAILLVLLAVGLSVLRVKNALKPEH